MIRNPAEFLDCADQDVIKGWVSISARGRSLRTVKFDTQVSNLRVELLSKVDRVVAGDSRCVSSLITGTVRGGAATRASELADERAVRVFRLFLFVGINVLPSYNHLDAPPVFLAAPPRVCCRDPEK
ncbi:hypothetical protein DY000_02014232 [Brassica cretica]|uniref:Uncharacterized protein n=1 Tax=Brassica cretica TaxID=69181 RepID=A0ABQ7D328_BRACR|nr:hypothetical protein DY000_02014232 [Brassica cretica]